MKTAEVTSFVPITWNLDLKVREGWRYSSFGGLLLENQSSKFQEPLKCFDLEEQLEEKTNASQSSWYVGMMVGVLKRKMCVLERWEKRLEVNILAL